MGKLAKATSYATLLALLSLVYVYWEHLDTKFQLTEQHRSLSDRDGGAHAGKNVTLYRNGYSTGGVQMLLNAELLNAKSGPELAEYFSQFVDVEGVASEDAKDDAEPVSVAADRVFNGKGRLITAYSDIEAGERLYLVAPGLLFVWPFVKLGHRVHLSEVESPTGKPIVVESFSESPRTFHLHNFFTYDESDRLIERILEIDDDNNKLQQSHVGHQNGKKQVSSHRTSENAFDQISDTAVAIRKRVFDVLSLGDYKPDMCDGLQLLRYKQKQAYIAHNDYFDPHTSSDWNWDPHKGGSNRFATVFMYLSNVTRGGQTVFPYAEMPEGIPDAYNHPADVGEYQQLGMSLFDQDSWEFDMVQKCSTKLASYPRKAHAILFYSQKPNGELDPMSFHGGCPVLDGTKWGANLWVWNKRRYGLDDKHTLSNKFKVVFQNPTAHSVEVFWSSTLMTTLEPHGKILYTTYTNHKWTLKIAGRTVLEFKGDAKDGAEQLVAVPMDAAKDEL